MLIGLDGASWALSDSLIAAGRMPNLETLVESGARAAMTTMLPTVSPALWTTMATGKYPAKHGISGFQYTDRKTGKRHPIDVSRRRSRAFWEILSDHRLSTSLIYWWNTWPAQPINGMMVSDYLFFARNASRSPEKIEIDQVLDRAA